MNNENVINLTLENCSPTEQFLANKVVLVTGASDGIGKAVSVAFAKFGATVILTGRVEKKLELTYDEIESAGGPQPAMHPMDFERADEAAYQQLAHALKESFTHLDGIVHCAANLGAHCPIVNSNFDLWQKTILTNLTAPYLISRECYPLLKDAESATVLFTSDEVARTGQAHWGAYAVTKAGADNLMKILADEWHTNTNITVCSIDPGPVRTNLRKQAFPGEDPRNLPTPDQVVLPYLYLMESSAKAASGQCLRWDSELKKLSGN